MVQAVLVVLALLGLDFLTGVGKAFLNGTFNLQKVPQFLDTSIPWQWIVTVVSTGIAQVALSGALLTSQTIAGVFITELGAISVKLAQDIVQKLTGKAPVTATLAT